MLKQLYVIWLSLALAAAVSLAGCSDDPVRPDDGSQPVTMEQRNVYVHLQLNIAGGGIPDALSRADGVAEPLTPGTSRENAVESIDLLVCDAEDGKETVLDIVTLAGPQIEKILANKTLGINLNVPVERKVHLHLLANLPTKMHDRFVVGESAYKTSYASEGSEYWDMIDEFVPGSRGRQETLENSGTGSIPMTGQFHLDMTDGAADTDPFAIVIPADNSMENPILLEADLCRMVAKSHVLVKSLIAGVKKLEYVFAIDKKAAAETETGTETKIDAKWLGWIRKDSVHYIPNAVNRSTYILPHRSDKGYGWADLNMYPEAYLTGGMARDLEFDAPVWSRDFVFYSGVALHRENIGAEHHYSPVETFVQSKHDNTVDGLMTPDRYTRGMYCPENYFLEPEDQEIVAKFAAHNDALPVVTHVSIAAKLTPRWIVIQEDYMKRMDDFVLEYGNNVADFREKYGLAPDDFGDADVGRWTAMREYYKKYLEGDTYLYRTNFRIIQLDTEQDAMDILSWSLMCNFLWSDDPTDFERGKYPDGTFYCYDLKYDTAQAGEIGGVIWTQQYIYLAAGAVAAAKGNNADIKTYSVPHLGGWGYYYTYVNATGAGVVDGRVPYNASQVTRNTYYLITVNNFGTPGGTITRPEYIKVNTEPVGWTYAGRGDIYLH